MISTSKQCKCHSPLSVLCSFSCLFLTLSSYSLFFLLRCLQSIIAGRLKEFQDTLADIHILDTAYRSTSTRLSSLRQSKVRTFNPLFSNIYLSLTVLLPLHQLMLNSESSDQGPGKANEDEEDILKQQLETLRTEK